jgi:hypothetical protein
VPSPLSPVRTMKAHRCKDHPSSTVLLVSVKVVLLSMADLVGIASALWWFVLE